MPGIDVIYGRNALREALRAGRRRVYQVFLAAGTQRTGALAEIVALAAAAGIGVREIDRVQLDKMAAGVNHHGVLAEASPYPYVELPDFIDALDRKEATPLVLILDYIQDPQNLGTLIRTAEGLAVDGIIVPKHRAAGVTPAVVSASVGATEHMQIVEATNLVRAMKDLQAHRLWMIGVERTSEATLYVELDLTAPIGLVIGAEGQGMSRLVRETCDQLVQLPMYGQIESLNAAVAGSVVLYEVWRQRSKKGR